MGDYLVPLLYFSSSRRYEDIPDKWTPPEPQPYVEQGNLHYYLLEPDAFDQFATVVNRGDQVQIWLNSAPEPTKIVENNVSPKLWNKYLGMYSRGHK